MKGIVRGVLGLALAVGMTACTNDDTVGIGGDFDNVDVDKNALFVGVGDSTAVLVRLVNDLRASTPASFTVSNGAGVRVTYDETYRPDYTQGDTLIAPLVKPQQRYWVVGTAAGLNDVTFTAGGASTTIRAYVTPKDLGGALSQTTGVVAGDEITITAPAGLNFSPTSTVTFTTGPAVSITNRAADGSSITFLVGPGVAGTASVTDVGYTFAPGAPRVTLRTTTSLDVPAITVAPTTASTLTPAFGATMTLTLGGNLRFTPTSTVTIGGRTAFIVSRSADSSTATIVPLGGSSGTVSYTGIVLKFLNGVPLAIAGDKSITVGAAVADPAGGSIATAPTVAVPAVDSTVVWSDAGAYVGGGPCNSLGGDGCRYFKIVLAAPAKVNFELRWDPTNTSDLGLYYLNSVGAGAGLIADALGNQAGGPEVKAGYTLPAGTSYIAIAWYDYGSGTGMPAFAHVKVTGVP